MGGRFASGTALGSSDKASSIIAVGTAASPGSQRSASSMNGWPAKACRDLGADTANLLLRQMGRSLRHAHSKRRAPAVLTLDSNTYPVQPGKLLYEREADARALIGSSSRALDSVKTLEQPRNLIR
jgi:hypothetical protein